MTGRALRVLFVANDGLSAGHVARALAIARALERRAARRSVQVERLLATTSEADDLLAAEAVAAVRLPSPARARRAGLSDRERRHVVRGAIEGAFDAFAPDLVVVDTFPAGPHGELAGWLREKRARRVLVRRSVPEERASDEALAAGLADYDLAVLAADPFPSPVRLPIPVAPVPPITMAEPADGSPRDAAREALGLPATGRVVLVAAGGGGDEDAVHGARALAETICAIDREVTVALAPGPLARDVRAPASPRVQIVRAAPLGPLMTAFDGAFAPAGYNTAHELVKARVPAALFARPRPFDDQAARAERFEQAALAHALRALDRDAAAAALDWMQAAAPAPIEPGGADRAADALLDLVSAPRAAATRREWGEAS